MLIKLKYNILGESCISSDYKTRVFVSMISTIVPEVYHSIPKKNVPIIFKGIV